MSFEIPGVLWRRDPLARERPLVFDSPHSGTDYPEDFGFCCPLEELRRVEDTYVDELWGAAPEHGATLIGAVFPRSYLDPNRTAHDIDPKLLADDAASQLLLRPETRTGLVRRIAKRGVRIYDRKLSAEEIRQRIDRCHTPYHRVLDETCERLHRKFGAVWHINCHSMPSAPRQTGRPPEPEQADFVLGDRDGRTCAAEFTGFVARTLRDMGYDARINEGYKGVEIVRRHGHPAEGRHSLQIEVDRALYMDQHTLAKLPGFDRLKADITRLIERVAAFASERARMA
ncbi:MAG: N-formylglutamate amidohydrolase [Alphaproteobacteria bacterium]|nr:N-formylglutamate amidohydrolase [Alphaproteobacteria bacterium]